MPVVWEKPDGSVAVMQIVEKVLARERRPGESTADAVLRLAARDQAKDPSLVGLTPRLVPSSALPATRAKRAGWRLTAAKDAVVEDDTADAAAKDVRAAGLFSSIPLRAALRVIARKLGMTPQEFLAECRAEARQLLEAA